MEPITIVVGGVCLTGAIASAAWRKLHRPTNNLDDSEFTTGTANVLPLQPKIVFGFSQGVSKHPKDVLLQAMREAERVLDMAVYAITDLDVILEIIKAHRRGVKVRIITDAKQSRHACQRRVLSELISEGILVKTNVREDAFMHLKAILVDGKTVAVGSYNFTKAAADTNEEVLVRIDDVPTARDWHRHFQYMWNDKKRYAFHQEGIEQRYA